MIGITIEGARHPITMTCPEHFFLEVSDLRDSTCFRSINNIATIYPEERVPHIKAKTVKLFVHWLYHQRFTPPGEKSCGFRQLLELYYLGHAYAMTILRNVVLRQLMRRIINHEIPAGHTRRMYSLTPSDDPLRRLWVDFYVWDVPPERFSTELESGNLDRLFLRDLALAQMKKMRALQMRLNKKKSLHMIPPYVMNPKTYHVRDAFTEACCHRCQQSTYAGCHREYCEPENYRLVSRLELLMMRLEYIRRENLNLKLQTMRLQEKVRMVVPNMRSKIRNHRFVPHYKLFFQGNNWDYPGENWASERLDCDYPGDEEVWLYHEESWRGKMRGRIVEGLGV